MRTFHKYISQSLVNTFVIFCMVIGLVSVNQVQVADAAPDVQPPVKSDGKLEIIQGDLIRISTLMGEEVSIVLDIKDPEESQIFSWSILNPPAHGDAVLEPAGARATVYYLPAQDFSGSEYFATFVTDQFGNTSRVAITIDIQSAPIIIHQPLDKNIALSRIHFNPDFAESLEKFSGSGVSADRQDSNSINEFVEVKKEVGEYYSMTTYLLPDGSTVDVNEFFGPSTPPMPVSTEPDFTADSVLLPEVPSFTWVFGSTAVSAAMIAGYYDRTSLPDVYTGPTNGGVVPLTDIQWGTWVDGAGVSYPNNPLAASRNGVDGRTTRGSIDDYWVEYLSDAPDPYLTNGWTQHTWGDAIGDYLFTSQSAWGNGDGFTRIHAGTEPGAVFTCNQNEIFYDNEKDGTVGMRDFYLARGYDVGVCYFQFTDNVYSIGFNLEQYKAEIDAGFPVMIHLNGHSLVGVGYEPGTNTIYIHDAWLIGTNTMEWGGSYQNMKMRGVSIVHPAVGVVPENDQIATPIQITNLPFEQTLDTSLATRAPDDPDLYGCGLTAGKASVWYRYSPAIDGMLDLDTFGSDYDTMIGVWSGAPGSLTEEACNDDFDGHQSKVFLPVKSGIDYYIGISEFKDLLSPTTATFGDSSKQWESTDLVVNKGGTLVFHASDIVTTIPLMEVSPHTDEVWAYRLLPMSNVTLTIGSFSTNQVADADGEVYFELGGEFDILAGSVISLDLERGGVVYTVSDMAIKMVSVRNDVVAGTGTNMVNGFWVYACNASFCVRGPTHGNVEYGWEADFGDVYYDLAGGDLIIAITANKAGNKTVDFWQTKNTYMMINPLESTVHVFDWFLVELTDPLYRRPLELRINYTPVATCKTDENMNALFSKVPVDILVGDQLEVIGNYTEIYSTVVKLKIKLIDPTTDTVKGKAKPGSPVLVAATDPERSRVEQVTVETNAYGVWSVDFSGSVDIAQGSIVQAFIFDQNGSATWVSGHLPAPAFDINPSLNKLNGWDWTPRGTVTVTIGDFEGSFVVDQYGRFSADLAGQFEMQPGQSVVVSDGVAEKTHVIRDQSIISIDDVTEVFTGTAEAESLVTIVVFDKVWTGTALDVQTDASGNWRADFAGLEDITQETWGWVEQTDEDGDSTVIDFTIPTWPLLDALTPFYAIAGQPAMTLYLVGERFVPTTYATWDGTTKITNYINSQLLSIELTSEELAMQDTINVAVFTPPPGGGGGGDERFTVISTSPSYGEKLTTDTVIFDWGYIPANGYKFQLSNSPDFSTILVNTKTTDSNFRGYVPPLQRGKTYYWRIRPLAYSKILPWSAPIPFRARDPLAAPELGMTDIVGYSVTLNWSPVEGAVKYKLQVAKDLAFTNLVINAPVLSPETSKLLAFPDKVKTYYWRVRAIDEVKIKSAWSEIGQFTVPLQ
jgi:hypothetical protein